MPQHCNDFKQGLCNRGDECKFLHSLEPEAPPTCYDFSIGKCSRGDNCKFTHAEVHVPHFDKPRRVERVEERRHVEFRPKQTQNCFDFTQGRCTRGADCKYVHEKTCFDYSVGKCHRAECRYLHQMPEPFQQRSAPRMTNRPVEPAPTRITNSVAPPRQYRAVASGSGGRQPDVERCFDFTQGRCIRGDACRYAHPQECFDYKIGKCNRASCRFEHVDNRNNLGGRDPTESRFRANNDRAPVDPRFRANDNRGRVLEPPRPQRILSEMDKKTCFDFKVGRCDRGNSCKFIHMMPGKPEPHAFSNEGAKDQDDDLNACFDFTVGKCHRGDSCKFSHSLLATLKPRRAGAGPY